MANITSFAEKEAAKASKINCFKAINLQSTKDSLEQMLAHIGSNNLFSEYTKHDISHVDGMLKLLEFIIPDSEKAKMTSTDWLLVVLSVYFHDLGMLITSDEFNNRAQNHEYTEYKTTVDLGLYKDVDQDKLEHNLYQEFVRTKHGDRIYNLISNVTDVPDNINPVSKILYDLLHELPEQFREDLATVCKSHQQDLDCNLEIDQPYEQDPDSTANVLYAAAILRTADGLHVNSERTPKIDYMIIAPKNSYSNREWVQQRSVTCIRPKKELDRDGNVDDSIMKHSFEVVATFKDEDAYSHFMDYLSDTERELKKTYEICKRASAEKGSKLHFPWDSIDRTAIKTKGFNAEKLRFELDKDNILKLLIGHTLYSHANVVLRELTQNAIDACRLMNTQFKDNGNGYIPKVEIYWDNSSRTLTVKDNGTGMDEHIILNYLLKVGASRYQSQEFKENNKSFHSISRFGIGLLTCFMISDEIEITTKVKTEEKAHRLRIKNIQGEYLLRNDADCNEILENKHGSTFKLKVREDAVFEEIENNLRQWIIVPGCSVTLNINGEKKTIGYNSEKEALSEFLLRSKINIDGPNYELREYEENGMKIVFLVRKSELYNSFSLYSLSNVQDDYCPVGICIEGIKVSDYTPGFNVLNFAAVVNCVGDGSPTTNVARDRIEDTEEYKKMLKFIYNSYLSVVSDLYKHLSASYSLPWAVNESSYVVDSIVMERHGRAAYSSKSILDGCLRDFKCVIVDNGSEFQCSSLNDLGDNVWTIESIAFSSAIKLVQEIHECDKTSYGITKELMHNTTNIDRVYSEYSSSSYINELFLSMYEVTEINIDSKYRKIEFCWNKKKKTKNWLTIDPSKLRYISNSKKLYIQNSDEVKINGIEGKPFIVSKHGLFLLSGNGLCTFMCDIASKENDMSIAAASILSNFIWRMVQNPSIRESDNIEKYFSGDENFLGADLSTYVDLNKFKNIVRDFQFEKIDFSKYYNRNGRYML